ncbi:hypothetical protein [Borrelia persica]|uniref:hypothetical protein n=1 Tax=Borrelia persica TaxID=44448 RepID=UPI0004646E11|nr:hypothetical protein [Borrelia persica]
MLRKLFTILILLKATLGYSKEESEKKQDKTEYFYINIQMAYYPPNALGTLDSKFSPSFITPKFESVAPNKQIESSSWGSAQLISYFGYHKFFKLADNPDSPLLQNNGIDIDACFGLAPVIALLQGKVSFTPIAFVNLYTGIEFGMGWQGFGFKGVGVHLGNGEYSTSPEFYSEIMMGGRLQFDLNAILDGEWTHIITVAGNNFTYRNNPHAHSNQLWKYKADEGKNVNGLITSPYALLAYKMPIPLNLIGFLYEGQTYIGNARGISTTKNKGWGSDFFYHNLSFVAKIQIIENLTLDMLLKFSTAPVYTANTIGLADITKRIITNNSYIYYDSIGFSLTYKF